MNKEFFCEGFDLLTDESRDEVIDVFVNRLYQSMPFSEIIGETRKKNKNINSDIAIEYFNDRFYDYDVDFLRLVKTKKGRSQLVNELLNEYDRFSSKYTNKRDQRYQSDMFE